MLAACFGIRAHFLASLYIKAETAAGLVIITKPAAILFHVQQYDIFTGL